MVASTGLVAGAQDTIRVTQFVSGRSKVDSQDGALRSRAPRAEADFALLRRIDMRHHIIAIVLLVGGSLAPHPPGWMTPA
ncbi:MAG: hypothetical protein CM15mP74_02920 [Halieaceae bacterium]|nr:MAG: hypothetical protein CM15mP74_02920 [Halieaceae bacterium]